MSEAREKQLRQERAKRRRDKRNKAAAEKFAKAHATILRDNHLLASALYAADKLIKELKEKTNDAPTTATNS